MSLKSRIAVIAGVILAVIGIALALRSPAIRVDAATVKRGKLALSFEEQGKTELRHRYLIAAPTAGTLQRIALEQGDAVRADEVVASMTPSHAALLDPATRRNTVAQLAAASAEVDAAGSRLAAAAAADKLAAANLARLERLQATGAVSSADLDAARSNADGARAAHRGAAADRLASAQRRTALAALLGQQGKGGGHAVALRSPIDGVVLRRYLESEVPVVAGQSLLELGDTHDLDIEVDTLSQDAVKLRPGMAARIIRWGGAAPLDARVWRIEPGGFTKISALGVEEQRTRVRLDILSPFEQWKHLGDGFRVEVRFLLAEKGDVLQVPSSALFRENGRNGVYRIVSGRARRTFVRIGLRGALDTEIVAGLKPGERVIAHPDDRIADGVRVSASP